MTRSSAYNLRSAPLTSSARQEIAVKRERAASPNLQALSARPRKKQKTQVAQPTAELSGASGSARHTRAHDANPHPDCLVCYPGGITRKVKIEATLVRHTRAHDSVPHPDCDVCRLSQPAKPSRPSRPKKALPRKAKRSTCVSASPTPSLGFDILSSEPDFAPLTPLPADDGSDYCEIVKKEPTDEPSACSFSSSLSHLHEYLAGASIPQSVVLSLNQGAYSHPAHTTLGYAPPKTAKHASQCEQSNHASSANPYSIQISPLCPQSAHIDPSKSSEIAFSRTAADKVLAGVPATRNAASVIPGSLAMNDSYRPVKPSNALPPRLNRKLQKVMLTPLAAPTTSSWDASGSRTNASTEMLSPSLRVPVIPSSNKCLRSLTTRTQPGRSSQLALTSNIEAKLQLPRSSVQDRKLRSLGDSSKSAGSPQHAASHFGPPAALSESTVSTCQDIRGELRQPSLTSGFRDVYSAVSKTVNHPRFPPREPLVSSSPQGQSIVPTIPHAARGSTKLGLMEEVLSHRSRTTKACVSSTPTPQQGHLHRQTPNSDTQISFPASLPLDSLPTPYDSARSTQTKTTSLVLPSVPATETPLASSISPAARNNALPTLGWLSGLRPFHAPLSALTGPGVPGSFVAPHQQDPLPPPPAHNPSAVPRNNRSDSLTAASTILPARKPALQAVHPPHAPGGGDSVSRSNAADSPEPVRPRGERSTGPSPKDPPVSDAVVDFVKVPAMPGSAHPGGADAYQDAVKVETPPDVVQTPSAASPKPSCDAAKATTLRLAYSSEDEPLIIAVKRKAATGAAGVNTEAAVGTAKAAKSGGSKGKRAPRSAKARVKKEDADLAIDNKPKGRKNKTQAARKITSDIDSVPPGGPSNKGEEQEPKKKTARAPRKPRKKAQPKDGGKPQTATGPSSAPVLDSEWQALWSGPSSLFPCPAPWTPSEAWTAQGGRAAPADGHARVWPTDGPESPCDGDTKKEHAGPVLMHPPRHLAYDAGSLMAYQGCRWDADGFNAMELSALPWLASTCAPMVVDGSNGAGAEHIIEGPDFSLPAVDPSWSAYIQLLTDVPATAWAPLEM
ncbi:hypothetical protein PHLGIDRAFT_120536 [Phlebiopsis gigantea 11061_1 CR5-6]|uniref:Uncharacterized protein n=1 Tax=Phlebiopsis gigantea (strain 11061_1 CR5-6) TaxID=745531 RepID=A0A0C3NIE2_PHLG1|nr:hypothetical protein PHLGIDRAFT_120536 [Phlebiopsis gigantea 11061_1 CR5-6]